MFASLLTGSVGPKRRSGSGRRGYARSSARAIACDHGALRVATPAPCAHCPAPFWRPMNP